jgi:hypothetical protein
MKRYVGLCVAFIALLSITLFAADGNTPDKKIIGVWKVDGMMMNGKRDVLQGDKIWFEFAPDGKGRAVRGGVNGEREIKKISWRLDGSALIITEDGKENAEDPANVSFSSDGRKMTLGIKGGSLTLQMSRINGKIPGVVDAVESGKGEDDAAVTENGSDESAPLNQFEKRIAGVWRLQEYYQNGKLKKDDYTSWIELNPNRHYRVIERRGEETHVDQEGVWFVNGKTLSIIDGRTEDAMSFDATLSAKDTTLELCPKGEKNERGIMVREKNAPEVKEAEQD